MKLKKITKINQEDYIIIPNGVPAIVSEELWNKCAEIRQARINKFQSDRPNEDYSDKYKGKYALSGKIICGICGKAMWHDTSHTQSKYRRNSDVDVTKWTCRNYRMYGKIENNPQGCESTRIYDREIIVCLRKIIFDLTNKNSSESIKEVLDILKSVLQDTDNTKQIKSIENQIFQIKNKSSKLLDAFLDNTIDKVTYNDKKYELDEKIKSLNSKINQLKLQASDLNTKEVRLKNIENFLNNVYEKPENIPLEFIDTILHHITICHNPKGSKFEFAAKIVLNLSGNNMEKSKLNPIYTTTYNFIKQQCRKSFEEWEIIVYI